MSRLQTRAKPLLIPLIGGEWPPLSGYEQKTIAAWATMFTMVVEFADPNTLTIPFQQRDHFRLTQTPPDKWVVWIGNFNGGLWRGVFNHFAWGPPAVWSQPDSSPVTLTDKTDSQSTAIAPGRLFLMTFSTTRLGLKVEERAFARRFGLRVLWPDPDDPIIRPDQVLDDLSADTASASLSPLFPFRRRAWET
jgi:hypothetical protein